MGGSPERGARALRRRRPAAARAARRCPVLLVHGTADRTVSVKPGRRYVKRAREAVARAELVEIDGAGRARTARTSTRAARRWAAVTRWLGQAAVEAVRRRARPAVVTSAARRPFRCSGI